MPRPERRGGLPVLLLTAALASVPLIADFHDFSALPVDPSLETALTALAETTFAENPKLTPGNLSLTVIDLDRGTRASYRPEIGYHPASVVKIFFLAAAHHKLARGEIRSTAELGRAFTDMIEESSNDATAYVVDVISGTTGGPELEGRAWRRFYERRMWVNHYFARQGYTILASGKTWGDGPYGRERQLLGTNRENRNRFTSEQPAALLYDFVMGRAVSKEASARMLTLMQRDLDPQRPAENQVNEFLGAALPPGSRLWSKAGWTSEVRHDAALIELPGGRRFIAVVLTRGNSPNAEAIPAIGRRLVQLLAPGA
jgi:beta-lactamase class A